MITEQRAAKALAFLKSHGFKIVGDGKAPQSVLVELPYVQGIPICDCCDDSGMCWDSPLTSGVDIVEVALTLPAVREFLGY